MMPRNIHVPTPIVNDQHHIVVQAPSKSEPGIRREVHLYSSGRHFCSGPGHYWFKVKQMYEKKCRHVKMSTIPESRKHTYNLRYVKMALSRYVNKHPSALWRFINCQFPYLRPLNKVRCTGCPLYPQTCNKYVIYYGPRQRHKPLVWRLQTAMYHGRRKDAKKMLRRFMKEVENARR